VSHPDLDHLGALPYCVGKLVALSFFALTKKGMKAKIYGTVPVYKMGQMFMYDAYQSRKNMEDFDVFNLGMLFPFSSHP
jgi:cleavage and polyadenylation specificity factor subunit 2